MTAPTPSPQSSPNPAPPAKKSRKGLVATILIIAAIVALFVVPLALHSGGSGDEEKFGGTDSKATEQIEQNDPGYKPWFHNIFNPGSSEVESGLFALQAAAGALILGYCLGRLHAKRIATKKALAAVTATGTAPTAASDQTASDQTASDQWAAKPPTPRT